MTDGRRSRSRSLLRSTGLAVGLAALLLALQSLQFYREYTPRMAAAANLLGWLTVESATRDLRGELQLAIERLQPAADAATDERRPVDAWRDFELHYTAAPGAAIRHLQDALPAFEAGVAGDVAVSGTAAGLLQQYAALHEDPYKPLLDELRSPPAWLWPAGPWLSRHAGYLPAATFNRAQYLALTGDAGTARVMLAGLSASAREPELLSRTWYLLGRIQFEMFRGTREVEYYLQSLDYLRRSLEADQSMPLARRLLDYLLSLPPAVTVPDASEGRPEMPSEGEGAAISDESRIF